MLNVIFNLFSLYECILDRQGWKDIFYDKKNCWYKVMCKNLKNVGVIVISVGMLEQNKESCSKSKRI